MRQGFALWVTGRPASGKSTVTAELVKRLGARGQAVQVLESDALRKVLTPKPTYSEAERDWFYDVMLHIGKLLAANGVDVIFDATGNKRVYRDRARADFERFCEVYVKCPPEVCMQRDPKGIYRTAKAGRAPTVPGLGSVYEEPLKPEVAVDCEKDTPEEAAERIMSWLEKYCLRP